MQVDVLPKHPRNKEPTLSQTNTFTHPQIKKPTHTHTPTHYKTHTYTHPHITKPTHYKTHTHTHTHTLQNPHIYTPAHYKPPPHTHTHTHTCTHYKTHTYTHHTNTHSHIIYFLHQLRTIIQFVNWFIIYIIHLQHVHFRNDSKKAGRGNDNRLLPVVDCPTAFTILPSVRQTLVQPFATSSWFVSTKSRFVHASKELPLCILYTASQNIQHFF